MKKVIKLFALVLLVSLVVPVSVFAQGTTSISISNNSPKVGDTFTVTVTASESGQMTISYNSTVIKMTGSTVNGSTTSHSLTANAQSITLTFEAVGEGTSGVAVTSPTLTGSSINIPVSNGQAAEPAPAPEAAPAPAPEPAQPAETAPEAVPAPTETPETVGEAVPMEGGETEPVVSEETPAPVQTEGVGETGSKIYPPMVGNATPEGSGDFLYNGVSFVVSERYPDEIIPAGFVTTTLTINGSGYRELTNGLINLVYLKREDDQEGPGKFFIYDETANVVINCEILGNPGEYVITLTPDRLFMESLIPSSFTVNGVPIQSYSVEGATSEFYYLYGINETLTEGWYAYDTLLNKVNRADIASLSVIDSYRKPVEAAAEEITEESSTNGIMAFFDKIFEAIPLPKGVVIGIAVFVLVIIIVIIINIILKRRDSDYDSDDYYDEDYEDYDDDYEEEVEEEYKSPVRTVAPKNGETEAFDIKVKELSPDDLVEAVKGKRDDDPAGEAVLDDIINKVSKKEKVDLMDLDDL